MKKNTLLFCTGPSGSGKTYFIQNNIPNGLFYTLKSTTTRPMRPGESEGNPYYFRDEAYFDTAPLATHLWVNRAFWTPGTPKWLYGIPEFEVQNHLGQNLIYDVIEPQYARQLIDWFNKNGLAREYNYRIAYFISPEQNLETARARANMPNDTDVRRINTCEPADFLRAGLDIDYILMPRAGLYNPRLTAHIKSLSKQR